MSESRALSTVPEADYEAIEGAVMETARGRWFLAEYARRNRSADTDMLLGAIGRIETLVQQDRETQEMDRLRFDLMEMAKAIARTKSEIASLRPPGSDSSELNVASEALDAIVRTTERATSDILEAAEHVQEAAWTLREEGANEPMCDELDRRATDIYTACSFQDLTAQRTSRIVNTLRYLEGRINAMIEIWGTVEDEEEDDRKQPDLTESLDVFNGLSQADVDDFIVTKAKVEGVAAEEVKADEMTEEVSVVDAYFFDTDVPAEVHIQDIVADFPEPEKLTPVEAVESLPEVEEISWSDAASAVVTEDEVALSDEPKMALDDDDGEDEDQLDEPFEERPLMELAELDALDVTEKLRRFT
jgi:chemotaxis regulatin CheY-phosphate phosphatase CheZ